ncbi:MAG: Rid family hydrolase [Actinomycetota bacterium]|nr:Rid family hydrolase [Actinomycetota bacterium]
MRPLGLLRDALRRRRNGLQRRDAPACTGASDEVRRATSPSRYAPAIGFSAAVRAGGLVLVSGTTAVNAAGDVVGGDDAYLQAREALRKTAEALRELGADVSDVVQTRVHLVRAEDWRAVGRAHGEAFAAAPPAATMVVVAGLLDPRMLVEVEAVAVARQA